MNIHRAPDLLYLGHLFYWVSSLFYRSKKRANSHICLNAIFSLFLGLVSESVLPCCLGIIVAVCLWID